LGLGQSFEDETDVVEGDGSAAAITHFLADYQSIL
jgi:hypothetical protein